MDKSDIRFVLDLSLRQISVNSIFRPVVVKSCFGSAVDWAMHHHIHILVADRSKSFRESSICTEKNNIKLITDPGRLVLEKTNNCHRCHGYMIIFAFLRKKGEMVWYFVGVKKIITWPLRDRKNSFLVLELILQFF